MAQKTIIDLEMINTLNSEGCPACHRKFSLGDPVVLACGPWDGGKKFIHENEAVFSLTSKSYFDRQCYATRKTI